ncbi:hypothetical protein J4457_01050 [Candidatus Woesearchaeota archaeon]|nr:hypothetical protein [Candidatus Woesearchaeota archaeon]
MALEDVKKQIVEEAQEHAEHLLKEAKKEAEHILKETERELSSYKDELSQNAEKLLVSFEKKELASAEFDGKRSLLDKKRELINKVIEDALHDLQKQSAAERRKLISMLLNRARKELDVKRVYTNKQDSGFIKEKNIQVKVGDIAGGIIAESADGTVSIDLSFETLLQQIRENSLMELNEALFNE